MSDPSVPHVDTTALAEALQHGAPLIDVRSVAEFVEARVPGAKLIPLDELGARIAEIPKNREVYVICASGMRSAMAVQALIGAGYRAVNVAGGTKQWIDEGRTYDTGPVPT